MHRRKLCIVRSTYQNVPQPSEFRTDYFVKRILNVNNVSHKFLVPSDMLLKCKQTFQENKNHVRLKSDSNARSSL